MTPNLDDDLDLEAAMLSGYIAGALARFASAVSVQHAQRIIAEVTPIRASSEFARGEPGRIHLRTSLGHDFEISITPLKVRG